MLIPFGVLSAAGAAGFESDFELISTTIVSGTATSSVVFSNLGDFASTYRHLQIRAVIKTNHANPWEVGNVRLNGDTGSNYSHHDLLGNGSSVTSAASVNSTGMFFIAAGNTTANSYSGLVVDLLDCYSTTKNKTIRMFSGASSVPEIRLSSGSRRNTESTTSVTLTQNFGTSILAGSRYSIYGIKG